MLAAWGETWVAGEIGYLFSQDQFPGLRLAEQIMFTLMLNQDPAFFAEQYFAVYLAFGA